MLPRTAMVLALLLANAIAASAQSTNAPARLDFSTFKLVNERNIFNPNRSARSAGRSETRLETRPAARTESFALVGIMEYEKGRFAFFDSTSSQYKKVVQVPGTVANFKVVAIAPNAVKLASGTTELELAVGMQLSRAEEGEWQLAAARAESSTAGEGRTRPAAPVTPVTVAPLTSPGDSPFPFPTNGQFPAPSEGFSFPIPPPDAESGAPKTELPAAATPSGAGESDVLRRLIQRREQELNR